GIHDVLLHEADAAVAVPAAPVALNSELAARLDALVDSGSLFVAEAGPAFKDRLVARGCTAHNPEQAALLTRQHAATCALLDGMVKSAVHGTAVDSDAIAG